MLWVIHKLLDVSSSASDILAYLPFGPTVMEPEGGELRAKTGVRKTQVVVRDTRILEINFLM